MKLTVAFIYLGAYCLSSVQSLAVTEQYDWKSPCKEKEDKCWKELVGHCDVEDNECIAEALLIP